MPFSIGTYLGLTGARLSARDAMKLGLASHFVSKESVTAVLTDVREHSNADEFLAGLEQDVPGAEEDDTIASLWPHREAIRRCFPYDTVGEIFGALDAEAASGSSSAQWADETARILKRASPTSVGVSLEALIRGEILVPTFP